MRTAFIPWIIFIICLGSYTLSTYCCTRSESALVGVLFGIPAIIVGTIFALITVWIFWRRQQDMERGYAAMLTCFTLALVSVIPLSNVPLSQHLQDIDQSEAKAFVAGLVPTLEAYYAQHGTYPQSIEDVLPENQALPLLLRDHDYTYYEASAESYYFCIRTRIGFDQMLLFESETGEWRFKSPLSRPYHYICDPAWLLNPPT
ncbi:MAG: hypothetical protein AAF633_00190 [Chloroflexota bacterium]